MLGPFDGFAPWPSTSLRDVFGLSLDELVPQHVGAAGELAEQIGVVEQRADAAALERLVAQDAAERAHLDLALAQRLLAS